MNRDRWVSIALATAITVLFVAALAVTGGGSYAAPGLALSASATAQEYEYPGTRPGWGCGDENHVHTGPPGAQYGTTPPPGCTQYGKGR